MSEAGPKLYANKPKKAQRKQSNGQPKLQNVSAPVATPASSSSMSAAAASYKMGGGSKPTAAPPPTPPPQPPKESFAKRYKFVWPLLLAVNFTVGAYLFTRTRKKDSGAVEETAALPSVTAAPMVARDPIPENRQRELFKWILEEKTKMKPKDAEEKRRLEEEKAVLKHFIRAKSVPSI